MLCFDISTVFRCTIQTLQRIFQTLQRIFQTYLQVQFPRTYFKTLASNPTIDFSFFILGLKKICSKQFNNYLWQFVIVSFAFKRCKEFFKRTYKFDFQEHISNEHQPQTQPFDFSLFILGVKKICSKRFNNYLWRFVLLSFCIKMDSFLSFHNFMFPLCIWDSLPLESNEVNLFVFFALFSLLLYFVPVFVQDFYLFLNE